MKCLLFLLLLLPAWPCTAQISDAAIAAFSTSYAAEKSGDYTKAINDVAGVYNDNFYEAALRLGWLYYGKKDYSQSLRYYRQAMKLRPSSIEAMFGFANPAAALTQWADVFATYQKILSVDAANSLANYRIALMYYYRKEWSGAIRHLQVVLERYPFDYDSILLMAQVKLAEGKTGESKSYYERALLYSPSNDAIREVLKKL